MPRMPYKHSLYHFYFNTILIINLEFLNVFNSVLTYFNRFKYPI